jgi:ssDNA-binding Zn-finger/Zn-ribbon topoisomerase 1
MELFQQVRGGMIVEEGVATRLAQWILVCALCEGGLGVGVRGSYGRVLCYVALIILIMLLKPDHGFTRGRATKPGQTQCYACREFPKCQNYVKIKVERSQRFRLCPVHHSPMDKPIPEPHGDRDD